MNLKKLVILVLALAMVLSLAAGCTTEETKVIEETTEAPATEAIAEVTAAPTLEIEPDTVIEFWHAMSGANGEALDALVADFNEINEYGIEVIATYQGSYGDLDQKLLAALSGGESPNIAQAYANNIAVYMESGKIVNLDGYIFDENFGVEDFEDIVEGYRNENSAYPDGSFYSLPFNKSTEVLYYNKTFFEENNLTVPTTWEELTDTSKAATDILGAPAFGYDSLDNLFITWTQQAGGEYTDSEGNVMFDNDAAREAVNFFTTGVEEGYFRSAGEDSYMSGPFNNGEAVMFIGSTSGSAYLTSDTFEWDAAMVPFGKEKKVIQQGSNMFMLSVDENEQVATFEFMKYIMSPEATAKWAMGSGYLPVRVSARELPEYVAYVESNVNPTKNIGTQYDPSWYIYDAVFAESYGVRQAVGNAVEEVISGLKDTDTAITDAANSLQ